MKAERKALLEEVERLAREVCHLKSIEPDSTFYGLPCWVNVVRPEVVELLARGNPLFDQFRDVSFDLFECKSLLGESEVARFRCTGCGAEDMSVWSKVGVEHWHVGANGADRVCGVWERMDS